MENKTQEHEKNHSILLIYKINEKFLFKGFEKYLSEAFFQIVLKYNEDIRKLMKTNKIPEESQIFFSDFNKLDK